MMQADGMRRAGSPGTGKTIEAARFSARVTARVSARVTARVAMLVGMAVASLLLGGLAGCGAPTSVENTQPTVSADVKYVLDKLSAGSREERADALKMVIGDRSLYGASEDLLRHRVFVENDLFLREQMIDGLAVMAVDRLFGPEQVKEYGIRREAEPTGWLVPPEPPTEDLTVVALERLIHDDSDTVVSHARAARARLGVKNGFWGLVVGLEGRETTPELADLSLVLLRQVTGLHMSADPEEWWALYDQFKPGLRYLDHDFTARAAKERGL